MFYTHWVVLLSRGGISDTRNQKPGLQIINQKCPKLTPRGKNCIDENQRWSTAHIRQSNGTHTFISLDFDDKTYVLGSVEYKSLNSGLYSLHDKIWYL